MIKITTIESTTRDASKIAEPPPTTSNNSSKQTQHGYVLAQSNQSPTTVNNETMNGTDNSERELFSHMGQITPHREAKDTIVTPTIYVNIDKPDQAITPRIRINNVVKWTFASICDNINNVKIQTSDLISRESDPRPKARKYRRPRRK